MRVVEKAAEIIRQDIRSAVCEVDTYPPSTKLFSDASASVPKSLLFLIEEIVIKNIKSTVEPLKKKSTAICHAIMSAVRPRSFISPLLLAVTVHFHRYFGSRRLIDILSSLGFPYGNANLGPYLTRSDLYQKLALYIWFDLGNFRSVVN